MTTPSGVLSVRQRCDGGDVASTLTEIPDHWFVGASHYVIMVHGFNNDVAEAREYYTQLTSKLPERFFPKIGWFYWPGDADLGWLDFLDFLSYPTDIKDAKDSALLLANALTRLAQESPGAQVTMIGHSLGCRLIAECVDVLAHRNPGDRPVIHALLFMAAAVPVKLVEAGTPMGKSLRDLSLNGTVFHSTHDLVLQLAFPAGQTAAAAMGYESAIYLEAVGRYGNPDHLLPQLSVNCSGNRHGDYWNDERVFTRLCEIAQVAVTRTTEIRDEPPPRNLINRQLPSWSVSECKLM